MFPNEVVNAEMQCDRQLVHFQALAIAKAFSLKPLQFLPDCQKCALYMACSETFYIFYALLRYHLKRQKLPVFR